MSKKRTSNISLNIRYLSPSPDTHIQMLLRCCSSNRNVVKCWTLGIFDTENWYFLIFLQSFSYVDVFQVAILVPFRNRHEHLPILFQHLIPALQRQRLQFGFYIIEQVRKRKLSHCITLCGSSIQILFTATVKICILFV